jgi:type I restriction enzyme, S subunit
MAAKSPIPHPSDWKVLRLGAIATKIGSGATPIGGEDSYLAERSRFALVRSQNVFNRHFDFTGLAFISDEQATRLQGVFLQRGDLLLNITGDGITFSRACAVPVEVLPACVNQHVSIIRVNPTIADPGYVLSYLTHPLIKSYIESFNAGGSRRAITKAHIESLELPLPPLTEQRAIAHILGTLDDKIELNRRMSETLEAMARALFKSWFVDLDPVRVKAEGRSTGLAPELDSLFPDSFQDSELGEIPSGWEPGTLSDLTALNPETWSKETRPNVITYVDLSNTKWGHIEAVTTYSERDAPSRAQRVLRPGDTIVGLVRPGNGSYAYILNDGLTGSTGFAVLRPRKADHAEFVYLAATAPQNIDSLTHLADGAAYPAVRPEVVAATQICLVRSGILEKFSRIVCPILARLANNDREAFTLAAVRDLLLPKLLSGQLRVKDAGILAKKVIA